MAELEQQLISPQSIALHVNEGNTFNEGEKLLGSDLHELGLCEDTNHMKIEFDNDKSANYCFCKAFIILLSTIYGLPIFLCTFPCIWYNAKVWAKSRLAAVTDNKLVLKQGYYSCCCVCYNESTKSVPLDKITDLRLEQGCIQRCYDIQAIVVETASSAKEKPEMTLVGLFRPRAVRSMILKVRDNHGLKGTTGINPLLGVNSAPQINTEELEQLITNQHQTMIEIKDVLQDMKSAIVSMDQKMGSTKDDNKTEME